MGLRGAEAAVDLGDRLSLVVVGRPYTFQGSVLISVSQSLASKVAAIRRQIPSHVRPLVGPARAQSHSLPRDASAPTGIQRRRNQPLVSHEKRMRFPSLGSEKRKEREIAFRVLHSGKVEMTHQL